jgi:ferritin-like metal-binding protein YciE
MQPNNSDLRDALIEYLQDMYAVENHLVDVLTEHSADAADFPVVQAKIQEHLEQTKQHRQRMEDCLSSYGKKPSGGKNALTGLMGKLQGALSGSRKDVLARNARDDFVAENFEIAAYSMLIATAQALGDQKTAQACQLNLRDEVNMAEWLGAHAAEAALTALVQDGITIPIATITQIQQGENQQMDQLWQQAAQVVEQDKTPLFANSTIAGLGNTPVQRVPPATASTCTSPNMAGNTAGPGIIEDGANAPSSGDTDTYLGSSSNPGPYGTPADQSPTFSSGGTNRPSTVNPPDLTTDRDTADTDQPLQP